MYYNSYRYLENNWQVAPALNTPFNWFTKHLTLKNAKIKCVFSSLISEVLKPIYIVRYMSESYKFMQFRKVNGIEDDDKKKMSNGFYWLKCINIDVGKLVLFILIALLMERTKGTVNHYLEYRSYLLISGMYPSFIE